MHSVPSPVMIQSSLLRFKLSIIQYCATGPQATMSALQRELKHRKSSASASTEHEPPRSRGLAPRPWLKQSDELPREKHTFALLGKRPKHSQAGARSSASVERWLPQAKCAAHDPTMAGRDLTTTPTLSIPKQTGDTEVLTRRDHDWPAVLAPVNPSPASAHHQLAR